MGTMNDQRDTLDGRRERMFDQMKKMLAETGST